MNNFERLKQLSPLDVAYLLCIDNVGDCRGCCTVCARHYQNNCDDECIKGVHEWLLSESEEE